MSTSQSGEWNVELEGQLPRLLRDLARTEDDAAREPLFDELRAMTGEDKGDDLSRWLAWYLEEHLGIGSAVGVLTGSTPEQLERIKKTTLPDGQLFDRAEYNWCALEQITNKDDMVKLRMLYVDLESKVPIGSDGPFSFRRLTGIDEDDLEFFRGKSLSDALFSEDVQIRHLKVLKDFGKMMMMPVFPGPTQRAGAILYAASISQALVRFDAKITSLSYKDLNDSLPGLLDRPYIVERYSALFRKALDRCE